AVGRPAQAPWTRRQAAASRAVVPPRPPACSEREPPLREVAPGHSVACHFVAVRDGDVTAPL
ncbi:hypothetical protein AD428_17105, partial [Achromobacter sp. DMS1]